MEHIMQVVKQVRKMCCKAGTTNLMSLVKMQSSLTNISIEEKIKKHE